MESMLYVSPDSNGTSPGYGRDQTSVIDLHDSQDGVGLEYHADAWDTAPFVLDSAPSEQAAPDQGRVGKEEIDHVPIAERIAGRRGQGIQG